MASKPLAIRMLEQRRIEHEVFEFDFSIRSADAVAQHTGVDPAVVYKTLVVEHDPPRGKPLLVLMPSTRTIDLRKLASALHVKKLRMASHRDAERHTGLQVGGISALPLVGKGFPVYIDDLARTQDQILVSAGQRGMDVRISVADLLRITGARFVAASSQQSNEPPTG